MIIGNRRLVSLWIVYTVLASALGCSTTTTNGGTKKKELNSTETARMYLDIANGALVEGDATGALENLYRAEKLDPKLPEVYHSEALAFYLKHDVTTALAKAFKAVSLRADYSDANNTLGKLLIDTGKSEEAIGYLLRAANDPIFHDAYKPLTNLGIIYYRRESYANAEVYFSRAINESSAYACVAHYYRGHIRLKDSRFRDALDDYDNAAKKTCAGFADAHLAMGMAYERSKQFELARKKYLEIENRFPNTKFAEQAMNHLRFLP